MKRQLLKLVTGTVGISLLGACSIFKTKTTSPIYYTDLVCNMKVEKSNSYDYKYNGVAYHFDSYTCKETFRKDPEKFINASCNAITTNATPKNDYVDPVCNRKVEKNESFDYKYKGKGYHFDSYDCMNSFKMSPEKFLKNTCDTIK